MLNKFLFNQTRQYSARLFIIHTKYRLADLARSCVKFKNELLISSKFEKINFTLPDRFKGGIVEKWAEYWKNLSLDYYDVYRDSIKQCKENPRRFLLLMSAAGFATSLAYTNPDEVSFRDALIRKGNELVLIGESVRNPAAVHYLKSMEELFNQGTVRHLSLGVLSLVWVEDYNEYVSVFKANCTYLQPRYLSMHERVLDIGLFNKWWIMDKQTTDYDINPEEWNEQKQ